MFIFYQLVSLSGLVSLMVWLVAPLLAVSLTFGQEEIRFMNEYLNEESKTQEGAYTGGGGNFSLLLGFNIKGDLCSIKQYSIT